MINRFLAGPQIVQPDNGITLQSDFSPEQLGGLVLWMDAALQTFTDAGTTPATNGQPIEQWKCKSTQCVFSQTTLGSKPTLATNAVNGKPVVRFDGTDDLMMGDATIKAMLNAAPGVGIFIVGQSVAATALRWIFWSLPGGINPRLYVGRTSASEQFAYRISDGDSQTSATTPSLAYTGGEFGVISLRMDLGAQTSSLARNGIQGPSSTAAFTAATFPNTSSQDATMGATPAGATRVNGDIAELIVYRRALTASETRLVETYLAQKYNLVLATS